jgi:hypothetical protein
VKVDPAIVLVLVVKMFILPPLSLQTSTGVLSVASLASPRHKGAWMSIKRMELTRSALVKEPRPSQLIRGVRRT